MENNLLKKHILNSRNAKDWQAALTNHLKVLDTVCHEHDIRYYLAFGGLLGAVRHRGHIPWDNDVDVVMTEENYLKLVELEHKGLLPHGYRFIDRNSEEQYPLLFGRFLDTRTSCPLSTSAFNGGIHGLFIDVFILFPLPNNQIAQEQAVTKFLVWEQLQCYIKCRSNNRTDAFIDEWKIISSYERQHGRKAALKKAESDFRMLLPSFDEAEWCLHGSGGCYNGFARLKTEIFREVVRLPFENIELDAPVGFQSFFEQRYGGSWRLFPEKRLFSVYSGSSLTVSGDVISRDFMKLIDEEKARETFRLNAKLRIQKMIADHIYNTTRARIMGELYGSKIESNFDKDIIKRFSDPSAIPHQSRLAAAEALDNLENVFRYQNNVRFAKWHVAIKFTPEVFTAALWARFIAGTDFWTLRRPIELQREDTARGSFIDSRANLMLCECLDACSQLYRAIDENDKATIAACRNILNNQCPQTVHAEIASAYALTDDPHNCLSFITTLPEKTRTDDYIIYLEAIMSFKVGKSDIGKELLKTLQRTSQNGMLLLAISDFAKEKNLDIPPAVISTDTPSKPSAENNDNHREPLSWYRYREFGLKALYPMMRYNTLRAKAAAKKSRELAAQIEQCESYMEECYRARRLTSDRIAVWEYIKPHYGELEKAIASQDESAKRKALKAYLSAVYRHMDNDENALFIDEFSFNAAKSLIIADRGQVFFNELEQRIPETHRIDVEAWLRSEGVEHPFL